MYQRTKNVDRDAQGHTSERWDRQNIYVKKRRKMTSCLNCVDASIGLVEDYIKRNKEGQITAPIKSTENMTEKEKTITKKQKRGIKQLYGYFK